MEFRINFADEVLVLHVAGAVHDYAILDWYDQERDGAATRRIKARDIAEHILIGEFEFTTRKYSFTEGHMTWSGRCNH